MVYAVANAELTCSLIYCYLEEMESPLLLLPFSTTGYTPPGLLLLLKSIDLLLLLLLLLF